ncbi:sarcosine oxidase subunit gamma [Hasllibacter sp. MH4015]|uniref:sarcosine oxidase subunit gamma n=1 Tax=Hasllibacter sp. MH4015 TaxID=2854029 RepID=UPI001CD77C71|nr:sarcosine oxidase subunit gamma [Hasllibacter sp. MH4015]
MANLTAKTAFDDLLPITNGDVTLSEIPFDTITWVAPYNGKAAAVSKALDKQIGADFPGPNRTTCSADARAVWTGPEQAFVLGKPLKPITGAAMADQTSAWAACALEGDHAAEVLARLMPIDLREEVFAVGHAARTVLGHMNCVLMRTGAARYEIMVFWSMASTCAHEIERAMRMVAARADA